MADPTPALNPIDPMAWDWDTVLVRLGEGAQTLKRACDYPNAPRPFQVLARADVDPEYAIRLQQARAVGCDTMHDIMVQTEMALVQGTAPGSPAATAAALANMRWRLERLDRKSWGAKVEVDGKVDSSVTVTIQRFTSEGGNEHG